MDQVEVTTVEEDSSQPVEGVKEQNIQGKMKDLFSAGAGIHLSLTVDITTPTSYTRT